MKFSYSNLSEEQKQTALQRLTALWAFTESGLGGIMHALQIPFTGMLVGGMAVIMISLIASLSEQNYKQVLKSAVIVLIIKAMVSPHSPPPAYIAVSFQAMLGYGLFSLLGLNFISITMLSTIAMLESAIQKLLLQTLFLGESMWKAIDNMMAWIGDQFGLAFANGSYWIIAVYLFIYLAGGCFIAWLAYHTIKNFDTDSYLFNSESISAVSANASEPVEAPSKRNYKRLWILVFAMLIISVILFLFSSSSKQGWLSVAKTISWTISAIFVWYIIITPLLTKAFQKILQKKQSRYSEEVLNTLSFLPVLRRITALAWRQSKLHSGLPRWVYFFGMLIHATLTYTEPPAEKIFNAAI